MTMVRMLRKTTALLILFLTASAVGAMNLPIPREYGKVIINKYSRRAGLAPVPFEHWLHRALYTCRLCHVDIGFAMQANATNITADSNEKGYYCGACHNGKLPFKERKVFRACSVNQPANDRSQCDRCHSLGKKVKKEYEYAVFTEKFPKRVYGGIIDWEETEAKKLISPVDFIEGVSIRRPALKAQDDFSITSHSTWMSDIIFSHRKHTIWNGCEVCHPEIFPSSKKGTVKYSMLQISAGQYCGLCHTSVAFPLFDCERCHKSSVR